MNDDGYFHTLHLVEPKNNRWQLMLSDAEDHSPVAVSALGVGVVLLAVALVVLAAAILRVAANHEPAAPTASKADVGVPVTGTSYYLLLVPLTAPVTFIFVYFNWLSFQFFQNT